MKKQALWPVVRTAAVTGFYALCAVGALGFADHSLGKVGATALRRLYELSRLPERRLGESWTSPALVRAALHTRAPRPTPSGSASAIWYGWIEEEHKSGKNSYTVIVCAKGEDEELELRQDGRLARLDLFAGSEHVALLKGLPLETLPLDRVALDFGEVHRSRDIPLPMQRLCAGKFRPGGNLTYREALIPLGEVVTVLGCATAEAVHSCASPPGALSRRRLAPVLRAYANAALNPLRGAAALVGVALGLLGSALLKLQKAAS